ncbi:phage head closure protein [Salipaludibacillus sp. CF4.18]|uniref:phage head closure protein n=1 Tax=Salipaludibacillus sp. CF4.18 TaxID=3373081 RepID=UPI003EE7E2E4
MIAITQKYTSTSDGMGGETHEWDDYLMLEGTLDQLSGDEVIASEKVGTLSTHVFIYFGVEDIQKEHRMLIEGEFYNIKNVDNPNNLDKQLEILLEYTGVKVGATNG